MHSIFQQLRIAGIASALPENKCTYTDDTSHFSAEELTKIACSTGVKQRYIVNNQCTSDLCFAAAEQLLADKPEYRDTIDVMLFITQTPDYILPATSCVLQHRLNLPKTCAAFDVNLGCSGYVYGLWMAANFLNNPAVRRVLLLVGDTVSRVVSPRDRSVMSLFGDAGTATVLEREDVGAEPWFFALGTDGGGHDHLKIPAGGFRYPLNEQAKQPRQKENDNVRSDADLYMNGAEIFAFTLREIPSLVNETLKLAQWSMDDVDACVFHQANEFMLQHLMKRLKIPPEKFILTLDKFGNTSSASIPLSISDKLASRIKNPYRLLLAGFGVGFSWAAAAVSLDAKTCLPPIVII